MKEIIKQITKDDPDNEVSKKLGIAPSSYSHIINGDRVMPAALFKKFVEIYRPSEELYNKLLIEIYQIKTKKILNNYLKLTENIIKLDK